MISQVASEVGITKKQTREVIDAAFSLITQKLLDGDEVWISGFGTFRVANRNPRLGRNPRTGEAVEIPARKIPQFSPSKDFKRRFDSE